MGMKGAWTVSQNCNYSDRDIFADKPFVGLARRFCRKLCILHDPFRRKGRILLLCFVLLQLISLSGLLFHQTYRTKPQSLCRVYVKFSLNHATPHPLLLTACLAERPADSNSGSGSYEKQQDTWLGDMVDEVRKVELHAGDTM